MPASISLVRNAICGCRGGNPLRAAGRPDIDLPDANHLPELINLASARSAAAPPLTEDLTVSRHKIGVAIMVGWSPGPMKSSRSGPTRARRTQISRLTRPCRH
jgi:hypothetical protein